MFIESDGYCFDSTLPEAGVLAEDDVFPQNLIFSLKGEDEEEAHHYQQISYEQAAMDMELQQQQQQENLENNQTDPLFIQEWGFSLYHHHQQTLPISLPETTYPQTPDLLSMFPLPSSFMPSLGLTGDLPTLGDVTSPDSTVIYHDPSMLPDLFHCLPQGGYGFGGSSSSSLFGDMDERDQVLNNSAFPFHQDGVFEFNACMEGLGKNRGDKDAKHFALEKQRRVQFKDKFQALRKLIPNPTKNDRASIVGDAIEYINELRRTVTKLEVLIENKRCSRKRVLMQNTTEGGSIDGADVKSEDDMDQSYNVNGMTLRSGSWLHTKSKNTEVDVRVMADEVTVKIVQHKGINCLLPVSVVLDELQLDLHHVSGGLIGDSYKFLFNYKIFEGDTLYASAIANKLIEAVEKHYTAISPASCG